MVSYEDILYTYNFSYGIREIYDLAPWAFDLLIFALVLSAIFKPVFRKLPIFAGHGVSLGTDNKSKESDRLAGILALVFASSTVYWMQVQGTNLMAASAYLILIMFAILGIFVYNLIAATEWGKKHKVISGVIAFVLTFGLCQALFGVGDIFSDVFPIITALLVFLSRILLWVIFFTAIILLFGRFTGKEEGRSGGSGGGSGGPSGGGPSSSGGAGFWEKAKDWIPYQLRTTEARKEIDIKEYEKNASNLELVMEDANKCAKELDKILQFQSSAVEKLKNFFKDLPAWLDQINDYFKKQNSLPPKQANDIVRFSERITEFSEAFNATIQTIKTEFNKFKTVTDKIKKDVFEFENKLKDISKNISSYNAVLQTQSDFFKRINDELNLRKLAVVQGKISDLSSKNGELIIQFKKLNQNFDEADKLFPDVLKNELVQRVELLKNFLELTNAKMKRLLVKTNPTNFSAEITVLKESALNSITHASNLSKVVKEVAVKNERFLEINSAMEKSIDEIRNTLQELSDLDTSIDGELTSSDARINSINEKKAEEDKVKKAQAEQERKATGEAAAQKTKEKQNYVTILEQLKTYFSTLQGTIGAVNAIINNTEYSKYAKTVSNLNSAVAQLNWFRDVLKNELSKESDDFKTLRLSLIASSKIVKTELISLQKTVNDARNAGEETAKQTLSFEALEKVDSLNQLLRTNPKEIDQMITLLTQETRKGKKK